MQPKVEESLKQALKDFEETKNNLENELGSNFLELILEAEDGNVAVGKFNFGEQTKYQVIVMKEDDDE